MKIAHYLPLIFIALTTVNAREFKHQGAKTALIQYELSVKKAQKEYDAKIKAAQGQLAVKLELALKDATRKGDLDEAIKIRDASEALENKPGPKRRYPIGIWKIKHTPTAWGHGYKFDGTNVTYRISNTTGEKVDGPFKLISRNGDILIHFVSENRIERFTFAGSALFVEHFHPASDYPNGRPQVIGRGVKNR
jgi:hypothetical protein